MFHDLLHLQHELITYRLPTVLWTPANLHRVLSDVRHLDNPLRSSSQHGDHTRRTILRRPRRVRFPLRRWRNGGRHVRQARALPSHDGVYGVTIHWVRFFSSC